MTAEPRRLDVAELEQVWHVEASATPYHWSHGQWQYSLERDYCYGIAIGGEMLAVSALSLALDEATLLNIAVLPGNQGAGLGRRLLTYSLQQLRRQGARHCFLEVRVGNQVARDLYTSMGFEEIGRRKAYYPAENGKEDALVMMTALNNGKTDG